MPGDDLAGLALASAIAALSDDPSTRTGCALVRPSGTVVECGYNQPPVGVLVTPAMPRPERLARTVHAEVAALLRAGLAAHGTTAYVWPWPPCAPCAAALALAGVARVVAPSPAPGDAARWGAQWNQARRLLAEAGVELLELPGARAAVEAIDHAD